MTQQLYSSLCI